MTGQPFSGVYAPIVTVFDKEENIRLEDIAYNVHIYNSMPLSGYMPLGSNGEFQGLTDREALAVLRTVCREKASDRLVLGGCGRESVKKTVEFIKRAADEGLDCAFILPPHYFAKQITDDGLVAYYYAVADRSPIPLVVYNAPKFSSGLIITPEVCRRLAAHPNIAALKNSSPVPNRDYVGPESEDFCVIAGNIGNFYSGLNEGAVGGVLSTASYLPEYCGKLYSLVKEGRNAEAAELNAFLQRVSQLTAGPLAVPGVKCGMTARGMRGGHVRLPLVDLDSGREAQFRRVFEENGIGRLD